MLRTINEQILYIIVTSSNHMSMKGFNKNQARVIY